MDRFRFRVWYPGCKKMKYFNENQYINFFQKKYIEDVDNSGFDKYLEGGFAKENLMQCTGFNDKNNKLIFEADLILFDMFGTGEKIKGKVIFRKGSYKVLTDYIPTIDGTHIGRPLEPSLGFLLDDEVDIEIIGNVYENEV